MYDEPSLENDDGDATGISGASHEIYFDGGCDPQTGVMETHVEGPGWHRHQTGITGVVNGVGVTGAQPSPAAPGTCNQAHWLAAILGLEEALKRGCRSVTMVGDSELVVEQADGPPFKCDDPVLRSIRARYLSLKPRFVDVHWRHVPKKHNPAHLKR